MLKFAADGPNGTLIGIGLSEANVKRLLAGDPIFFRFADLKLPQEGAVFIYGAANEDELERILREKLTPAGIVIDEYIDTRPKEGG